MLPSPRHLALAEGAEREDGLNFAFRLPRTCFAYNDETDPGGPMTMHHLIVSQICACYGAKLHTSKPDYESHARYACCHARGWGFPGNPVKGS